MDSLHLLAPNIADRLVIRARDKMATVKEEIKHYKEQVLNHIEVKCTAQLMICLSFPFPSPSFPPSLSPSQDYIIQHNHQYVIELDACLSSKELFKVSINACII